MIFFDHMEVTTFSGVQEIVGKSRNARRNAFIMTAVMDVFFLIVFLFVVPLDYQSIIIFLTGFSILFWIVSYALTRVSFWGREGMTVNTDLTDTRVWTLSDWFFFLSPFKGTDVVVLAGQTDYQKKIMAGTLEVDDEGLRLLVFLKWGNVEALNKVGENQVLFIKKSFMPFLSTLFDTRALTLQFQSPEDAEKFIGIARNFVKV